MKTQQNDAAIETAFKAWVGAKDTGWTQRARPGEWTRLFKFVEPITAETRKHLVPAIAMYDGPEGVRVTPQEITSELSGDARTLRIRVRRRLPTLSLQPALARPAGLTHTPRSLFGRAGDVARA